MNEVLEKLKKLKTEMLDLHLEIIRRIEKQIVLVIKLINLVKEEKLINLDKAFEAMH